MRAREEQREEAIERMADFVLVKGLGAATLRPLAAAAGTSDRMLLYYFHDKEDVITATLYRIVERMTAELDRAIRTDRRLSFANLLTEVWNVLASNDLKPFMPLWLELAAGASRGREPHLRIAGQIADGYLSWIASHLVEIPGHDQSAEAAQFMVIIEGMYMLHAVGRPDLAKAGMPRKTRPSPV